MWCCLVRCILLMVCIVSMIIWCLIMFSVVVVSGIISMLLLLSVRMCV